MYFLQNYITPWGPRKWFPQRQHIEDRDSSVVFWFSHERHIASYTLYGFYFVEIGYTILLSLTYCIDCSSCRILCPSLILHEHPVNTNYLSIVLADLKMCSLNKDLNVKRTMTTESTKAHMGSPASPRRRRRLRMTALTLKSESPTKTPSPAARTPKTRTNCSSNKGSVELLWAVLSG